VFRGSVTLYKLFPGNGVVLYPITPQVLPFHGLSHTHAPAVQTPFKEQSVLEMQAREDRTSEHEMMKTRMSNTESSMEVRGYYSCENMFDKSYT
jgi:hypothetical protein